jgi:hypothetical protein
MKITETAKGNIKLVMSREQAKALHEMLDNMTGDDYSHFTLGHDEIMDIWETFYDHRAIL